MARALHIGRASGRAADRGTYRQQEVLDAGSGTKLARHRPFIGTSGTKLARHTVKRQFWALFRLQGEYSHARSSTKQSRANFFTRKTRRRGDIETNDASATADAGQHETPITTATKIRTKIARFSSAKVMAVSTGAPHQPAKAMAVSTPHRHERAKATPVSDNRATLSHMPTPQKTRT